MQASLTYISQTLIYLRPEFPFLYTIFDSIYIALSTAVHCPIKPSERIADMSHGKTGPEIRKPC